ncbi:hypothetical protein EIN_288280 [Entamoeba invadens IP1]|uniref:RRM domain-containing protein n=1 Tax=Entamoeba invadens IP1 TaxID=370355 RepID=A0A0A1U4Z5_ENTIV|nr:hypothetical protein EIN_288280 [Entamoeba invadens IP1]ELP89352.1 hypothetical protein EIN_288280 [Entamoeba invadens IP1]|eukprot:XP_004256123.1 hypothetical protein EIN_288280 [Entamoeba invadens IP1]
MYTPYDFSTNHTLVLSYSSNGVVISDIEDTFLHYKPFIKEISLRNNTMAYIEFIDHKTPLQIHIDRTSYKLKCDSVKIFWRLSKEEIISEEFNYEFYGMSSAITDKSIQEYLGKYAQIKSLNYTSGKRGVFSIIKFSSSEDVENIFENYFKIKDDIGTKKFGIKKHKHDMKSEFNVLVNNIHPDLVVNSEFFQFFRSFGKIVNFYLTEINETYNAKSLYVEYTNKKNVKTLIKNVNGKDVFGCDMPLSACSLTSKNDYYEQKKKTSHDESKRIIKTEDTDNLFIQ